MSNPSLLSPGQQSAADIQQAAVDQGVLNADHTYVLSIETAPRVTDPVGDLIEVEPGICIVARTR